MLRFQPAVRLYVHVELYQLTSTAFTLTCTLAKQWKSLFIPSFASLCCSLRAVF